MSALNAEYQHFIPQFMVKNYAQPFECPEFKRLGKKRCKCKHEKGKHPGDLVVNCIIFSNTPLCLELRSVKRIFGAPGMYNNPARAETDEARRIETMFGKMESQASTILRRIVKSYEAGDAAVALTRLDRDLTRKFLFLLKYRGSTFHQRFYHGNPEDYTSNDRERLLDYMRRRNFSSPRDVWFHNLETIMNLKMDTQRHWTSELPRIMFPDDALWFIMHTEMFFMTICAPSDLEQEFILTGNSYNVFEGPNTFVQDSTTGEISGGAHAGFHEFAPISPRLMIVLRSRSLLKLEDDLHPEIRQAHEDLHWSAYGQPFGTQSKSLLETLPVEIARNTYSEVIDGKAHFAAGHNGLYRPTDKFIFAYHPIGTHHVQTINNILLDNIGPTSVLAFRNKETFFNILDSYISAPCKNHKIVVGDDLEGQYKLLRGLEALARCLGSQKCLVSRRIPGTIVTASDKSIEMELKFRRMMDSMTGYGDHLDSNPAQALFDLHTKFVDDKSGCHFMSDLAQAGKMVHFKAMVGAWTLGCSAIKRMTTLALLTTIFKNSRCARYWLYLKLERKSNFGDLDGTQDIVAMFAVDDIRQGPEDVFAKTSHCYDSLSLNELMYKTVMNDIDRRLNRLEDMWSFASNYPKNVASWARARLLISDKICRCGIQNIERVAKRAEILIQRQGSQYHVFEFPYFDDEVRLELMTRVRVRGYFRAVMANEAEGDLLRELEDVFFRLTFPTPGLG